MAKVKFTVPTDRQEVLAECLLNAPLPKVYAAFTDAKTILHWWGPAALTTQVELQELKVGGRWRFVQRDAQGNEYAFHGVYHAIQPEERIDQTFEWEGQPGHEILQIVTFKALGEQTVLEEHSLFQSIADRNRMMQNDMEAGFSEGIQRLEALSGK